MTTPSEVITALEKALEAGPIFELWKAQISQQGRACGIVSETGEGIVNWNGLAKPKGVGHTNAALIAAASPLAIRTLLDAHASALRDAAHWKSEHEKRLRVSITQGDVIANHVIAMQSALIDGAQVNPKEGLRWIFNTLRGPGLLPDMNEATKLGSAQAWFDAKTAEHEAFRAANPGPTAAPAIVQPIDALRAAQEWLDNSPHGENCFVSDHYEGDPGNQCNCGKDSLLRYIEEALSDEPAAALDDNTKGAASALGSLDQLP